MGVRGAGGPIAPEVGGSPTLRSASTSSNIATGSPNREEEA